MVQQDRFVIVCPWCKVTSQFEADLPRTIISTSSVEGDLQRAIGPEKQDQEHHRVFRCQNKDCCAPFEAVICRTLATAKNIQRLLRLQSWSPPRRFWLRRDKAGTRDKHYACVLFNRQPLRRWKHLHIRELIDLDLVAKSLLGFAVREGVPLTLFEALCVEKEVFWIPVEPLHVKGDDDCLPGRYTPICNACRRAFHKDIERHLHELDGKTGRNCKYFKKCPFHSCVQGPTGVSTEPKPNRCLLRLQLRAKYSCCYSSDLAVIREVRKRFEDTTTDPLECSPESDPGVMRVSSRLLAERNSHETEASQSTAGGSEVAGGAGGIGGWA